MEELVLKCCDAKLYNKEMCRCKSIFSIQRSVSSYHKRLHSLPHFINNKTTLSYQSINSFVLSTKADNDSQNKLRESIIDAIVNKNIPDYYFHLSKRWNKLKQNVQEYIQKLHSEPIEHISCVSKAGRKYNYDFEFVVNNVPYKVELKFNATKIDDTPQYNSPMKPSQYMSKSYEEYFYDNHLSNIAQFSNLDIPDKTTYLKEIHNNDPPCMRSYKTLYKTSEQFSQFCKNESKKSIEQFLSDVELDSEKLSSYLLESQKNKHYMMYSNNRFHYQTPNMDDYVIKSYIVDQKNKNRFICETKSGKKMYILLRWKNGNGIAFPAFQIS